MHARVTTGQLLSRKEEEALRLTGEAVLPVAREQRGCRGLLSFVDRGTGKSMVISLWETGGGSRGGGTDRLRTGAAGQVRSLLGGAAAPPSRWPKPRA